MILENSGEHKTLVIVLGHKHPEFMIDNEEAFRFFHPNVDDYIFTFIVDNNELMANQLSDIYGEEFVFFTGTKNGWGRGCLRSFVGGIEYFEKHHIFNDLITLDSDCICTGPFLSEFSNKCRRDKKIFFGGTIWPFPEIDLQMHHYFHNEVGMPFSKNFEPQSQVIAGPCMLWTESCLEFMRSYGWFSLENFDKFYDHLFFPHDQISTYMKSSKKCSYLKITAEMLCCKISRSGVKHKVHEDFGKVPIICDARVFHPTGDESLEDEEKKFNLEKDTRSYLKYIRIQIAKGKAREEFVEKDVNVEKTLAIPPAVVVHTKFIKSKNCTGCEEEVDGSEISQDIAKEEKGCNKTTKFI